MNGFRQIVRLFANYFHQSKSAFYSLLFTIPLIFGYEAMMFSLNHSDIMGMRNGADVLFRQFFSVFNIYGFYLVGFIVLLALIIAFYFHSRSKPSGKFDKRFFLLMLLESCLYAMLLFIIVDKVGNFTLQAGPKAAGKHLIALALGAGVYDEFIFRVVLISGSVFFLKNILSLPAGLAVVIAVIFSSFIFSWFHYLGPFGDTFDPRSFIIRFLAGIFLAVIYALRGFGIAAYSHTLYDLIVIAI